MKWLAILLAWCTAGCTVPYSRVADYSLYEQDDPNGFKMLTECLGQSAVDPEFDRRISRAEADAVRRLSEKINAGEALSAHDFDSMPCVNERTSYRGADGGLALV